MKKKPFLFAAIAIALIATPAFFAFRSTSSDVPKKQETTLFDPNMQGCSSTTTLDCVQCCNWNVPNSSAIWSGSTLNMALWACYIPSPTPPWTSSNQIGTLAAAYRPTSTVVVTATEGAGPNPAIFQVTIYTSGAIYVQQTGGRSLTNVRGTSFRFSYSPSCPLC